jgi:hypothetical protein
LAQADCKVIKALQVFLVLLEPQANKALQVYKDCREQTEPTVLLVLPEVLDQQDKQVPPVSGDYEV